MATRQIVIVDDDENFDAAPILAEANQLQKRRGNPAKLVVRSGGLIYMRGTFPPKPGSGRPDWHQQYISTGLRVTDFDDVQEAVTRLQRIGVQFKAQSFDWNLWWANPEDRECFSGFVVDEVFVREFGEWLKQSRELSDSTWRKKYRPYVKRMLGWRVSSANDLEALLEEVAASSGADSHALSFAVSTMARLLEYNGADSPERLEVLQNFKPASLRKTARDEVPSEDQIVQNWQALRRKPCIQASYGILAAYGCRPGEVSTCKWEMLRDGPRLEVLGSKDKKWRTCYPFHPEWYEAFELSTIPGVAQSYTEFYNNVSTCAEVSDTKLNALRHAWAIRVEQERYLPNLDAAKMQGHSPSIHEGTYKLLTREETVERYFNTARKRRET